MPSITIHCKVVGWERSGVDWIRRRIYEQQRTRDLKRQIANAWKEQHPDVFFPKGVPVRLTVESFRPLPKSRPKRVEWEPDVYKPDADNIKKLVMDALNGVAYVDDAQVVEGNMTKRPRRRGVEEGLFIKVDAVRHELYA